MPTIESLFAPEVSQRLREAVAATHPEIAEDFKAVVAVADLDEPAKPRPLTVADAIDIDPRSDAMIDAKCIDCQRDIKIDPHLPEGLEPEDAEKPRVPICSDCASIRVRHEAMNAQRNVEAFKRTRVAKHQPRTTDGIEHPVTVTHKTEENDMDLDNLSDAELGALVRSQMKAVKAEKVIAAKPAIEAERLVEKAETEVAVAAEQQARKERILPGFMVGTTLEIPDLDVSQGLITSLDEAPSAKERSPYNKARNRLTHEPPLDPETTTYAVLLSEHKRLRELAKQHNKAAKAKAKKVTATVAEVDLDAPARKAKALADVLGITEKKARKMLAKMEA